MNPIFTRTRLAAGGAITGTLVAGITLGATVLGPTFANAASASPSPSATTSPAQPGTPGGPPPFDPGMPAHGSQSHESAEAAVTGADATKAQAGAVKAAGGGTAGAVTTDFAKRGYEVTVTRSDGSKVEIHLDSNFNPMQGPGGPRPNDNDADDAGGATPAG